MNRVALAWNSESQICGTAVNPRVAPHATAIPTAVATPTPITTPTWCSGAHTGSGAGSRGGRSRRTTSHSTSATTAVIATSTANEVGDHRMPSIGSTGAAAPTNPYV